MRRNTTSTTAPRPALQAVTLLAAGALLLAGGAAPSAAAAQDPGQALFTGKGACFSCHRADAKGTPLAPDLTDAEWLNFDARPTADAMAALIRQGVQKPVKHPAPMPPLGGASLTDTEVEVLARYVLTLSEPDGTR